MGKRLAELLQVEPIPRAVMVAALLHKALELADTHEITRELLGSVEPGTSVYFPLSDEDLERFDILLKKESAKWPKARTFPSHVWQGLLRLALVEVATLAGFEGFSATARDSLNAQATDANQRTRGKRKHPLLEQVRAFTGRSIVNAVPPGKLWIPSMNSQEAGTQGEGKVQGEGEREPEDEAGACVEAEADAHDPDQGVEPAEARAPNHERSYQRSGRSEDQAAF